MIHRRKGRKFNRTASHRKALMMNLCIALLKSKRIITTEAKAKELRTYIEPLVTKAKNAGMFKDSAPEKNVHLRRIVRSFLNDKDAVNILFNEIGPMVSSRPGGYTRVLKTGRRLGDGAKQAIIEFVDYNYIEEKSVKEDKKSGKKKGKEKEPASSEGTTKDESKPEKEVKLKAGKPGTGEKKEKKIKEEKKTTGRKKKSSEE
jgi:large subunit ribosomal protein L17